MNINYPLAPGVVNSQIRGLQAPLVRQQLQGKPVIKRRAPRKKWKKPKDKPNRPLSAYNLYFQQERISMVGDCPKVLDRNDNRLHRKTHGKVSFSEMAKVIGSKWQSLPASEKKPFEEKAAKLKEQYAIELKVWKEKQKEKEKEQKEKGESAEPTEPEWKTNMDDADREQSIAKLQEMAESSLSHPTDGYRRALGGALGDVDGILGPSYSRPSIAASIAGPSIANTSIYQQLGLQQPEYMQYLGMPNVATLGTPLSELYLGNLLLQQQLEMEAQQLRMEAIGKLLPRRSPLPPDVEALLRRNELLARR